MSSPALEPWTPPTDIAAELEALWAESGSRAEVACWHLKSDQRWATGHSVWPAASLIKIPLAIAAYAAAASGGLDLEEQVSVEPIPHDHECEFDNLGNAPPHRQSSWRKVLDRALTESDNAATNALIDRLGLGAIAPLCEALGLDHTCLSRRMCDAEARQAGRENLTTVVDMARLLVRLAQGVLLDAPHTAELLALLGQQRSREKLARGLPPGTWFGHKTGELAGYRHDAGLVGTGPDWAVVTMVSHPEGGEAACDALMAETMRRVNAWIARLDAREAVATAWLESTRQGDDGRLVHDSRTLGYIDGRLTLLGETSEPSHLAVPPSLALSVGARLLGGVAGYVQSPCLQLRRGPGHARELVSQLRLGDPVSILDERGEWLLVRAPDGYVAWGRSTNVREGEPSPTDSVLTAPLVSVEAAGGRVLQLSAGTRLRELGEGRYALADGTAVALDPRAVRRLDGLGSVDALLSMARLFLGLPYLWGGASGWGIDCSGLVQLTHAAMGVALPRDADQQQAFLPAVGAIEDLGPGDPVFFPGHVGLYLGEGAFIHAAAGPGCVVINSFDPASALFDPRLRETFAGGGRTPLAAPRSAAV